MRRNVGYASLQRSIESSTSYSTLSTSLSETQSAVLLAQLSTFQTALTSFSSRHRSKISSSPEFRAVFSALCNELGVDPLGGGQKGWWDKLGAGEWYHALGVQLVDVCLAARERGGGLVSLEEIFSGLKQLRGPNSDVTESDIKRALSALDPLGCGYALIEIGGRKMVRCSPSSMDTDSLSVISAATSTGRGAATRPEVTKHTGWGEDRVARAIEKAVEEGLVWVDDDAGQYYVPGLFDFGP